MRTGTVWLNNASGQGRWFAVRESCGQVEYLLGSASRTTDGWAPLRSDLVEHIIWGIE